MTTILAAASVASVVWMLKDLRAVAVMSSGSNAAAEVKRNAVAPRVEIRLLLDRYWTIGSTRCASLKCLWRCLDVCQPPLGTARCPIASRAAFCTP